jgi:hypothetical protein
MDTGRGLFRQLLRIKALGYSLYPSLERCRKHARIDSCAMSRREWLFVPFGFRFSPWPLRIRSSHLQYTSKNVNTGVDTVCAKAQ